MDRIFESNEGFDTSGTIRLKILSVSLPAMGVENFESKNQRTIPDLLAFLQQKRSVARIIETDDNNYSITALAIGHERT